MRKNVLTWKQRLWIRKHQIVSWLQKQRTHPTPIIIIMLCMGTILLIFSSYRLAWTWTGFLSKSLWDWMQLLIIPLVLAIGGFLYNRSHDQSERDNTIDSQREATLQAYLDRMSELLQTHTLESERNVLLIAQARTEAVLRTLDSARIASLLRFLSRAGLINLKIGNDLRGFDLSGVDLNGINLENVYLQRTNLSSAELNNAHLSNAQLAFAKLNNAELDHADLKNASMGGAHLNNAVLWGANLCKVKLFGADLRNANLGEANLSGADLSNADLSKACFWKADLRGANLKGANLENADLDSALLENAVLTEANLRGTDLSNVDLRKVVVTKEQLSKAKFDTA